MSLLLNIDTATETAQVSFAKDGNILRSLTNTSQKDHASFLQTAINKLAVDLNITLSQLDAIAVVAGPGSYTGLRVALASAKGLCFGLNKPLVTLNTLESLAASTFQQYEADVLVCPMIDARRMEVFTAIYNKALKLVLEPCAMVLNENSFAGLLDRNKIIFSGNGSAKWASVCKHSNASFADVSSTLTAMATLSFEAYKQQKFADLAYTEPFYIKEFMDKPIA